jgi:hypothetical protein
MQACILNVRFEILIALAIKNAVWTDLTQYIPVNIYRHFGEVSVSILSVEKRYLKV